MYHDHARSIFVKAADISRAYFATSNAKVSYDSGSSHVKRNIAIGTELVVEYKDDSNYKKLSPHSVMYFNDRAQASQAIA